MCVCEYVCVCVCVGGADSDQVLFGGWGGEGAQLCFGGLKKYSPKIAKGFSARATLNVDEKKIK